MPENLEFDDQIAGLLKRTLKLEKFFPAMKPADAAMLFPMSGLYRYAKDEYVIRQGETSKDLFIVESGTVAITQTMGTAGAQLAALGPGEIFGEIALVRDGVRVASAVAAEECRIFRVAYPDIQSLRSGNPELAEHLARLAQRRSEG
ncbi:MAG: cyclic nucleotide-binding domain-containing protein [Elusimicrobiota bacterium]